MMSQKNKRYLAIGFEMIFLVMMLCSCSKEKQDIIPEQTMTQILKDVYMTTSLLETYEISSAYSSKDSITIYYELFDKYGYSHETVEKSLKYYFLKKTKKMIKMYNTMISDFSTEIALRRNNPIIRSDITNNLWYQKDSYILVGNDDESIEFDIRLSNSGTYTLSYDVSVAMYDRSAKPHMEIWTADIIDEGSGIDSTLVSDLKYVKDGIKHSYTVSINKEDNIPIRFFGSLYDTGGYANLPKCAVISNIVIAYTASRSVKDKSIDNRSPNNRNNNH